MIYKCELLIGGYVYPVTDCIKNWEDMTVSFKRDNYDGVVRTFTDKFEFVKGARSLLLKELEDNYLKASANIVVSTRNNSWTWVERFRCALNFSTITDDGKVLSINAIDNSVASIIKARKGVQYEYLVDEVKDDIPLIYDRLEMLNNVRWIDGGTLDEEPNVSYIEFISSSSPVDVQAHTFPMYISSSEIANKNKVEVYEHSLEHYSNGLKVPPFFVALENVTIHLNFEFHIYGTGRLGATVLTSDVNVRFIKKTSDGSGYETLGNWYVYAKKYNVTQVYFNDDITLKEGESLVLLIGTGSVNAGDRLYIVDSRGFETSFQTKGDSCKFNVIRPQLMLNKLLKSINNGVDELTGVIVPSGEKRLDNTLLLAADSARQMPNAKINTSFSKFCDWMSAVFGYVYDINEKTITFRPRKDYFTNDVVKRIEDYNGYNMSVVPSLIYSQLNIGYEKKDYDSVNGRDEFRFTNHYTTGVTMTDNKMELISPYRADAYGIEFLAQKIGEDTTDDKSDTDVFFVCANNNGNEYVLDRSDSISGVISPSTMFNAMYSPTSMLEANSDYLGGFIRELSFASSEGNTDVAINGKAERRDVILDNGLFVAKEVEIETSDIEVPDNLSGVIEFEHNGETVKGYCKSTDFNYTREESAKITIILKK